MKLPQIEKDKGNHFLYGFIIFFLSNIFLSDLISLCIVILIGIGKEIYDYKDYGKFDYKDVIFTSLYAIILTLYNILNK